MKLTTENLVKSKCFKHKGERVTAYLIFENEVFFVGVLKMSEPEKMILREMKSEKDARFEYNKLGTRLKKSY